MKNELDAEKYPELVIGIAGAIGIDIEEITRALADALAAVRYSVVPIRITREIESEVTDVLKPGQRNYEADMSYKMSHANAVCRNYGSPDTLMRFAIRVIRTYRASRTVPNATNDDNRPEPEDRILPRTAYVIRQLKRPEEVHLLRRVYGKQFILISAYGSVSSRKRILEDAPRRSLALVTPEHELSSIADRLMHRDQNEGDDQHGQHLRETFHLADVFIDGITKSEMRSTISRFIQALFGKSDSAPTKREYGMYSAKSAALRSSDLSRQVGAAIFTSDGDLIVQGCNEVPKAFGGTYWDGEEPDHRDVKLGYDPNDRLKKETVRDLLERLLKSEMLSDRAKSIGNPSEIVDALVREPSESEKVLGYGCLVGSSILDLTEYGRVVHAEMCAICDAARLGRSLKGSTLFCTTFPCHNCTKHILASGISLVFYMEPYPKSKAKELHQFEVEIDSVDVTKLSFLPFLGISPLRYRDLFEKGRRKSDGVATSWYRGEPRPMISLSAPTYLDLEIYEFAQLTGETRRSGELVVLPDQHAPED